MIMRGLAMMTVLAVLAFGPNHAAFAQDQAAAPAPAPDIQAPAENPQAANEAALQSIREIMAAAKSNVESQDSPLPPSYPPIIANLAKRGAQIQYLGKRGDFDGWVVMERGTPSYMYVSGDGNTVFQGLMLDNEGKPVTLGQVAEAQMRNPDFFNAMPEDPTDPSTQATAAPTAQEAAAPTPQTPSAGQDMGQTLYSALSVTNYVTIGATAPDAPVLYAFIDPECEHCERFLKQIDQEYLVGQKLQLRAIPIGLQSREAAMKAAYLLSLPNGGDALMAQVRGQKTLPANPALTLDGQQLNLDLFQLWKFDGTPVLVFKAKDGQIMMVRGEPKNMKTMYDMIAPGDGA